MMSRLKRALAALVIGLTTATSVQAQSVVVVRHAERDGPSADPGLSAAGRVRAAVLAESLGAAPDLILTSDLRRTYETATPTVERFGQDAIAVPLTDGVAGQVAATVALLRALEPGDHALVVGHSNTVPLIVRALGADADDMPECEYDRLTIVTLAPEGARAEVRRFGAPTPC